MDEWLTRQEGVVSRLQLLASGLAPHDVARLLRRRELHPLLAGVYVDHSGRPTWQQQAWGAVLACQRSTGEGRPPEGESAALHGESALRCHESGSVPRRIARPEVVVANGRRPRVPEDKVAVLRSSRTLSRVQWHLAPPRERYDEAVVTVAAGRRCAVDVVAELARAVGSRRSTPQRLLTVVGTRSRLPQRDLVEAVLDDIGAGTCSALEQAHLRLVERAHGLPPARRQARGRSRSSLTYRDADYGGLVVELDGRAWHDSVEQRDRDADRDLASAVAGALTVRLTWGQVLDRPCWTAAQLARLLAATPRRCSADCTVLAL